jgi:MrfA Zn-binding domain
MSKGPVRRGQLIAPFGVGALVVVKDGTSVLAAGLDHWYEPEGGTGAGQDIRIDEFRVEEWRLQRVLGVSHFRLPPDFRRWQRGQTIPNTGLTIPFLRFPKWHFCHFCRSLKELDMSVKSSDTCPTCRERGKRNLLLQVPFVALCDHGHIQDFPWREWVHRSSAPTCDGIMRLIATGGTSLADQKIECECGVPARSLANITVATPDGNDSDLSRTLDAAGEAYRCKGIKSWLGDGHVEPCGRPLRGSLRSASNVYYSRVYSAIFLPRASHGAPPELISLFKVPPLSTSVGLIRSARQEVTSAVLRSLQERLLQPYTDAEIRKALAATGNEREDEQDATPLSDEPGEVAFRRAEFTVLRTPQDQEDLLTRRQKIQSYSGELSRFFSDITLAYKLRETRAFAGFSRIYPNDGLTVEQHKSMLWRRLSEQNESWLPAAVVYGEGIFLELDEESLQRWETRPEVLLRIRRLVERYLRLPQHRRLRTIAIEPRFVLLHTLAHLLINKLTFECGYGSASLRERIYVSSDRRTPMAGVLIYTAAGDSEGTMGGLVRMGEPGYLEPVIEKAVRDAEWCSTDPVCMEIGQRQGQGPDLSNGAACHNCCLVPETSCEHFNRFLDRIAVVGSPEQRNLGFFSPLLPDGIAYLTGLTG